MSKTTETLNQYYLGFINQTKDWDFFLGLSDYMRVVGEADDVEDIIAAVRKSRSTHIEKINEQEKKAVDDLLGIKGIILQRIKDEKLSFELLDLYLNELEDRELGKIDPDHYKSTRIWTGLLNIMVALNAKKCRHILNGIVPAEIPQENLRYGTGFNPSEAFKTRMALSFGFGEAKNKALWGVLNKLETVPLVIFESDIILEGMKEKGEDTNDFERLIKEMDIIRNDGVEFDFFRSINSPVKPFSSSTDQRIREFSRNDYKAHAMRVHNHFIKELGKLEAGTEATDGRNEMKAKMRFENGVLRHGDNIHSFHRGQRGEKIRIPFFRQLWDDRRWVKNRREKLKGVPHPPLYFAVQLHLTTDSETFARNKKPKNQLFGLIKGINRILKQKKFPARIQRKGGIQLVVTEK